MARNRNAVQKLVLVFEPGQKVAFYYEGAIRSGVVQKLTNKTVTLFDNGREAFRTFSLSKINK